MVPVRLLAGILGFAAIAATDPLQEQFLPSGFRRLLLCGLDQAFERAARHPKLPPGQNHQEMCNLNYSQKHQTEP